jgi:asparagine synthase (glutamine-hydrolysing)
MCGIAGIVRLNGAEPVDEARLKRMRDVLAHRGPDGEGVLLDGPVGFGHRRLAIVDVAGGHQPLANEDESVWVVCNGEIYNHLALRAELERKGHAYRTRSDTETIVHLYEEEGDRCVERLRGMFAFALWDRARRRVLLARDRLGIKPLYYAQTEHEILFASEIKAILAARNVRPQFEHELLPEFLATRFAAGERTFFRGILKLLPGRTLSWSPEDGIRTRRYWQLPVGSSGSGQGDGQAFDDVARELRRRLEHVVASHLMSDVPLGLFLSGGIDSSALAGIMAPMVQRPLRTFSVGFDVPEANELDYARLAARHVGARHREVVLSGEDFFRRLPRLVWHEDEPIAFSSSIALNAVAQIARDDVKVVLTGEGADELFLGYSRYWLTDWNERAGRVYRSLVPDLCRRHLARATRHLPSGLRRQVERTFVTVGAAAREVAFENFAVFGTSQQHGLLADPQLRESDPYADALRIFGEAPGTTVEAMSRGDLQTYLVELLMKQDQMSMAASVESRVPFLDHELVEYATAIPIGFKLRRGQTKAVFRAAVQDVVPDPILRRGKMGFPVPLAGWFRGPFWPVVQEFVLGERARERRLFDPAALGRLAEAHRRRLGDHAERLWLLVNLEIWHRLFIDGDDVSSVAKGF